MIGARIAPVLLVAVVVVAGCGDDGDTEPPGASQTVVTTPTTTAAPAVALPSPAAEVLEIDADVASRIEAGPVTWSITATNVTDEEVAVTFATSQVADALVEARDGTVAHRWSDGRFFTPQTQTVTFAAGEERVFEVVDDLSGLEPGSYRLVLALAVVEPPEPFTKSIRVVAPDA